MQLAQLGNFRHTASALKFYITVCTYNVLAHQYRNAKSFDRKPVIVVSAQLQNILNVGNRTNVLPIALGVSLSLELHP